MSTSPAPRRRRTQQERTAESTERLVRAAIELIAEKGFQNTTTAEIGERAGYSRSMVQFRYGTKEALLESLLRDEYETRLLVPPVPGRTGLDRVLDQVDRLRDAAAENPELMRGFYALCFESIGPLPSLGAWIRDLLERYEAETVAAITAGQRDGSIRRQLDPLTEARALIASGLGHAFRWMATPETVDYAATLRAWRAQLTAHLAA